MGELVVNQAVEVGYARGARWMAFVAAGVIAVGGSDVMLAECGNRGGGGDSKGGGSRGQGHGSPGGGYNTKSGSDWKIGNWGFNASMVAGLSAGFVATEAMPDAADISGLLNGGQPFSLSAPLNTFAQRPGFQE